MGTYQQFLEKNYHVFSTSMIVDIDQNYHLESDNIILRYHSTISEPIFLPSVDHEYSIHRFNSSRVLDYIQYLERKLLRPIDEFVIIAPNSILLFKITNELSYQFNLSYIQQFHILNNPIQILAEMYLLSQNHETSNNYHIGYQHNIPEKFRDMIPLPFFVAYQSYFDEQIRLLLSSKPDLESINLLSKTDSISKFLYLSLIESFDPNLIDEQTKIIQMKEIITEMSIHELEVIVKLIDTLNSKIDKKKYPKFLRVDNYINRIQFKSLLGEQKNAMINEMDDIIIHIIDLELRRYMPSKTLFNTLNTYTLSLMNQSSNLLSQLWVISITKLYTTYLSTSIKYNYNIDIHRIFPFFHNYFHFFDHSIGTRSFDIDDRSRKLIDTFNLTNDYLYNIILSIINNHDSNQDDQSINPGFRFLFISHFHLITQCKSMISDIQQKTSRNFSTLQELDCHISDTVRELINQLQADPTMRDFLAHISEFERDLFHFTILYNLVLSILEFSEISNLATIVNTSAIDIMVAVNSKYEKLQTHTNNSEINTNLLEIFNRYYLRVNDIEPLMNLFTFLQDHRSIDQVISSSISFFSNHLLKSDKSVFQAFFVNPVLKYILRNIRDVESDQILFLLDLIDNLPTRISSTKLIVLIRFLLIDENFDYPSDYSFLDDVDQDFGSIDEIINEIINSTDVDVGDLMMRLDQSSANQPNSDNSLPEDILDNFDNLDDLIDYIHFHASYKKIKRLADTDSIKTRKILDMLINDNLYAERLLKYQDSLSNLRKHDDRIVDHLSFELLKISLIEDTENALSRLISLYNQIRIETVNLQDLIDIISMYQNRLNELKSIRSIDESNRGNETLDLAVMILSDFAEIFDFSKIRSMNAELKQIICNTIFRISTGLEYKQYIEVKDIINREELLYFVLNIQYQLISSKQPEDYVNYQSFETKFSNQLIEAMGSHSRSTSLMNKLFDNYQEIIPSFDAIIILFDKSYSFVHAVKDILSMQLYTIHFEQNVHQQVFDKSLLSILLYYLRHKKTHTFSKVDIIATILRYLYQLKQKIGNCDVDDTLETNIDDILTRQSVDRFNQKMESCITIEDLMRLYFDIIINILSDNGNMESIKQIDPSMFSELSYYASSISYDASELLFLFEMTNKSKIDDTVNIVDRSIDKELSLELHHSILDEILLVALIMTRSNQ